MVLGLSLPTYTVLHVIISVIGIGTGLVVVAGMWSARRLPVWTAIFLATTTLTSVTGFGFPFERILPSHVLGVVSLVVLGLTIPALYVYHLAGRWRSVYVVGSVIALYLNSFVFVVQAFLKVPFLTPLAPTQSEPPFAVAQLLLLVIFVVAGIVAVRAFRPEASPPLPSPA